MVTLTPWTEITRVAVLAVRDPPHTAKKLMLGGVRPAGSVSLNATPVRVTAPLAAGLVIVNCSCVVELTGMAVGLNALLSVGGPTFVRLKVACGADPAATSTVYAPAVPFAVNTPGFATPADPPVPVVTDLVPVVVSNVPLCPLPPGTAVNTTGVKFGIVTPPASFTVTAKLPNAVLTAVDCVALPLIVIDAGTWITVTLSVFDDTALPELVWSTSPPPNPLAELLTETGELAGMFTVNVINGKFPPEPATTSLELQVTILLLPTQLQLVPVKVFSV